MNLRGRAGTTVVILLFVSLALNFVAVGYIGSRNFWFEAGPTPAERLVSLGAPALPKELRQEIVSELTGDRASLRAALREVRDARQALLVAMRGDPYDEAGVRRAFDRLRQSIATAGTIGEQAILRALAKTPADVRAEIEPPPAIKK